MFYVVSHGYLLVYICPPQEQEVRFRDRVHSLREKWDEKSKDFISGFMGMFGRDGRIVSEQI